MQRLAIVGMIADHVDEHRYYEHSGYCESFLHLAENTRPRTETIYSRFPKGDVLDGCMDGCPVSEAAWAPNIPFPSLETISMLASAQPLMVRMRKAQQFRGRPKYEY